MLCIANASAWWCTAAIAENVGSKQNKECNARWPFKKAGHQSRILFKRVFCRRSIHRLTKRIASIEICNLFHSRILKIEKLFVNGMQWFRLYQHTTENIQKILLKEMHDPIPVVSRFLGPCEHSVFISIRTALTITKRAFHHRKFYGAKILRLPEVKSTVSRFSSPPGSLPYFPHDLSGGRTLPAGQTQLLQSISCPPLCLYSLSFHGRNSGEPLPSLDITYCWW